MSLRSGIWTSCRRVATRARALGFELRMGLALAVTLAAVLGLGYVTTARVLTDELIERDAQHHAADARSLETVYNASTSGATALRELDEALDMIARRPGVTDIALVNSEAAIIDATDEGAIGSTLDNPHLGAALRRGISYAGHESNDEEERKLGRELEFVTPLELRGEPYALEIDADGAALDEQLAAVRDATALVAGGGLILGLVLFHLLGGHALTRRHRHLTRRATLDPLTDLRNHRAFQEELQRACSYAARRGEPLALALVDLDDFKFINDTHGHRHGDEVLIALARVLSTGRAEDQAFRIGGDEFAVLFRGTDGDGAREALTRMLADAQQGARPVTFTAGVAEASEAAAHDTAVIWEQADAALYEGKRAGGGGIVVFDDVAELLSVVTPDKVRSLRSLLDEPRVDIAFQPILRLRDQSVLGLEALARPWEGYGFDGPADAFAVAEKVGRAPELDAVCRAAALARADTLPEGALLFLNVHPQTLDRDALDGERLVRAVHAAGLRPSDVVLEVTERSQARLPQVITGAARLRDLGFRIALDDVGSGNSGLETLRQLPVDFVKIDRSIIASATTEVSAQAVLVAIVAYARRTGAFVIAEGIESDEILSYVRHAHELDAMRDLSIEGGQGYLLGRPSAEGAVRELAARAA